jgi:8-hydroxy-5-deazaflavin:NADPH oxidoreductase
MRIGILGSGLMGGTLGTILTRAGHEVVFSYSRSQRKLERLAKEAGGRARAGTPADAVADADAVLLAVHWSRLDDVLDQTGTMARKTIVTCSLPMTKNDSRLVLGLTTSGAEMLAARRRNVHVVSAFSTAPSEVFPSVFEKRRQKKRPSLVFCGDHTGAKKTAAKLIRDVGFDPVDVGELSAARYIEPFALLLAEIAYEAPFGGQLAYRFEHLGRRARSNRT